MSSEAQAFWVARPDVGEIRREALPPPAPADVVVEARWSGISRGTEALVFHGQVPLSEYQRMRAPFQAGDFPGPVKYGYSSVGVVSDGPADLRGRGVFCLHPHQTRYVVPATAVHPIPVEVPLRRAVLAANLETALNGIWDAGLLAGDKVSVVGAGTVGCLVAWLAGRTPGCEVELVDVNPRRAQVAASIDVRFATADDASADADIVFHTSGAPDGLATALRLAGTESMVVDMSWYGGRLVTIGLGGAFHSRRLTIRSSQVGQVALAQRPRWTHTRRLRKALDLLVDPALDALITGESPFDALPETMARLAASPGDELCHAIVYPHA